MFKLDNFGVILFVSFSYKKLLQCSFMKIEKIDFSAKNSKKFVYYNEELVTNSKFQTQLSRKLQRFRTCRKNKKCSIFHDLSEYIIFHMIVTYWTGPLTYTFFGKPVHELGIGRNFYMIHINIFYMWNRLLTFPKLENDSFTRILRLE